MKTYRGVEVQLHSFLTSVRWKRVVSIMPRPLHPRERVPAPTEWAPESLWTGGEDKQRFLLLGFELRIIQPVASDNATYIYVVSNTAQYGRRGPTSPRGQAV